MSINKMFIGNAKSLVKKNIFQLAVRYFGGSSSLTIILRFNKVRAEYIISKESLLYVRKS